jgi:hypothetical protein
MDYTYDEITLKNTTKEGVIKKYLQLQENYNRKLNEKIYLNKECIYYKKVLNILVESGKISHEDLDIIMKFVNI